MDNILYVNTSSVERMVISTSMEAMPQATIDFSPATYVSGTFVGSGLSLARVSASYIITGSSTTASFAYTASIALNYPSLTPTSTFATQSIWATQSAYSTQSLNATYSIRATMTTQSIYATQALWATNSIYAYVATQSAWASQSNWATNSIYSYVATQSAWASQSSWATNSIYSYVATQSAWASQSSWATNSIYSYVATQSAWASQSFWATQSLNATYSIRAAMATQSMWATQSTFATYSTNAISSSWASRSLFADSAPGTVSTSSTFPITSSWAITSSFGIYSEASAYTLEPNGFVNQVDSYITCSDSTRIVSIYPATPAGYNIFSKGYRYLISTTQSVTIANTSGSLWYCYYAADSLNFITSSTVWAFGVGNVPVCTAYWDGARLSITDERHGATMDEATHRYFHATIGPRYASGLNAQFTGSSGEFIVESGAWYDEDIRHSIDTPTYVGRVAYYSQSMIVLPVTSSYRNGQLVWNNTTTGALTSLAGGEYGAWFIYVIGGPPTFTGDQLLSVVGQRVDTSLSDSQTLNTPDTLTFGEFPYEEAKLIYRVIVRGDGTWMETTDYRQAQFAGTSFSPADHGTLSGLSSDDHLQYLLLAGRTGGQTVVGGITGSLLGSASYATTASFALNGGGPGGSLSTGSTYPITASWAQTASVLVGSIQNATYATSASWATTSVSTSVALHSDDADFTFFANGALSASYSKTASFALNVGDPGGSLSTGSTYPITASWSITSSYAMNAAGGGTGYIHFVVQGAKLPASSSAGVDATENNWRLLYDDTSPESASWQFVTPDDYSSAPTVRLCYSMNSTQTGTNAVVWRINQYSPTTSEDVNVLDLTTTIITSSLTNNQTAGYPVYATGSIGALTAGGFCWLNVERVAGAAADTATSDAELIGFFIKYTK